jgi:threonyl-tRNA synthetase
MHEELKIRVEGSVFPAKKGTPLSDVVSRRPLARKPLLASLEGKIVDLSYRVDKDVEVLLIYAGSPEALDALRHSASHLLAHAVLELYPGTQVGIGPIVENGFYYDFLRECPFTPEDLSVIETKMKELAAKNIPIEKVLLSKEEAVRLFQEKGQELKVQLVKEKGDEQVTCYRQGSFIDFCLGPHLPSTGSIRHFKLLSVSGAYWKGDEKGIQLQRIYGTAFFEQNELEAHLAFLEEARRRDHRKLGQELDLFSFNENLGGGLILWHPKGATVRYLIETFWHEEHLKDGYEFLYTPHVAKLDVWRRSGHTEFYEALYPPLQAEGIEYELKPMNCPFHIMVYNSAQRSYRDLPLRWAELGTVYRYERSGVLHGLLRARGFTQDDAHIFCRGDQLETEILGAVSLALRLLRSFGFKEYDVYLATRPDNYVGAIEDWEKATSALEHALNKAGLDFHLDEGEGVFYGPKIDIKIKDSLGRSWQCTTVQLDFNMSERFDLHYVGEDGKFHRPFMIHRALLGSLERFFGVLIEHYKGNFPFWLAPVQVMILPIAERHHEYASGLDRRFKESGLRSRVDGSREKIGYKIRDAEMKKVPLILIVGDKEINQGTASLRIHGIGDKGSVSIAEFLEKALEMNKNKTLDLNF